nr:hypothetical protein [uncultured Schaedlerella sp.]
MKRKTKKDIESIMQTMLDAHSHVVFLLESKQISKALDLLAQCQECALNIGKAIEKSEGIDTQAVLYLEEYCEHLYKMSRTFDKKGISAFKLMLDNALHCVQCEIENIPLERLKIVFMPYKVSMWDCMESVWRAAKEDEECDTYVVPIPYYEKDQQGNIKEMCYEGGIFPKYVPITHYSAFSLKEELPDVVYIHNPYDGANYVTTVHPDYYSSNLKTYTSKLIYIPYYILGGGSFPEHHRNLPAYKNIDKIVVQDKEKADSLSEYIPEDKILIAGSPKIDCILDRNRDKAKIMEHYIPIKWKKKIEEKKVFLFNISITGILENSRIALCKIKYVISVFEDREDVVLWWRPHPLIEATLKSMRPEMYAEYIKIKNEFVNREKGIFDETGEASIAAVIADAYIGENSSSLINYFGVLGKPVFYINWNIIENKRKNRNFLYFNSYIKEENRILFIPTNEGLEHNLFSLDLNNGIINKLIQFPGTSENKANCYWGIKKIDNRIVLIPTNAKDIYIYDFQLNQAMKIVLSTSIDDALLFSGAIEYEGKLFLLPICYPAIVSIDIHSFKVLEYKECISHFLLEDGERPMFSRAYIKKEEYLYLASLNDSKIIIFNLKNGSFKIKTIGNYMHGYTHMIHDGEHFWLAAWMKNSIVRWNENSGETEEYIYPLKNGQPVEDIWNLLLDKKNTVIICSVSSLEMFSIDKSTGKCEESKVLNKLKNESEDKENLICNGFLFADYFDENTVVIFNGKDGIVNIGDIRTGQWKKILCRIPLKDMLIAEKMQIEKFWISKDCPYNLSENNVSILQFIDYVSNGENDIFKRTYECYQGSESTQSIGTNVHECIKQ